MTDFTATYPQGRSELLEGKTELTEDDIADLIELKHEYADMRTLKKYTDKKYRDLTEDEKTALITALLNDEEYLKYKNCYIAKSKLLYDTSETLIKETAALSRLNDLGYEVYLLPYAYARDGMNCYQKSADSITAGDFLEMKSVVSTGERAGQNCYEDAIHQADNIYLSFVNDISEDKAIKNIYRSIGVIKQGNKKHNRKNDFSGILFLNFEKKNSTSLYQISADGFATKIASSRYEYFKKIKGTAHDSSQVVENPMTEHGSSRIYNIPDNTAAVKQNPGSEMLYGKVVITVNGRERSCEHGVLEGFKNAVKRIDSLTVINKRLEDENRTLRQQLRRKENRQDYDDGWDW